MRKIADKIIPFDRVGDLSVQLRSAGKRIISTNGCFDILHLGHIDYLSRARLLGDVLVVGVNSDSSVTRLKGRGRPFQSQATRTAQVAALESVDYVVLFEEATPEAFLERLRPYTHIKGGDYSSIELPERAVVERFGGKVECIPLLEDFSTTKLAERIAEKDR